MIECVVVFDNEPLVNVTEMSTGSQTIVCDIPVPHRLVERAILWG